MAFKFGTVLIVAATIWSVAGVDFDDECIEDDDTALLQRTQTRVRSIVTTSAACPAQNVQVSITQKVLDYFMNEVFPIKPMSIGAVPMAPIAGNMSGLSYSVSNIQVNSFAANGLNAKFVAGKGLEVGISGLQLDVSLDYSLTLKSFGANVAKAGSVSLKMGSSSVSMSLIFGKNAAGNPTVTADDVVANLNVEDVSFEDDASLSCLGSLWSDFLLPAAQGAASEAIAQAVESSVQFDLTEQINSALATSGLPLKNSTGAHPYEIAIQLCDVAVAHDSIALNLFVAVQTPGNVASPGAPYSLNQTGYQVTTNHMVGIATTEWFVDGMVWLARREAGLLAPAPVKLREEPGKLPDGRPMKEVAEEKTKEVAKEPQLQASMLPTGFAITDTKVRFFNKAIAALVDFSVDVPALVSHMLASTSAQVKF